MLKRQSTNVKLAAIINSNAEETAESEAEVQNIEKLAKLRLQRACLYGGGARTLLPKTKKVKKPNVSPFTIPGAIPELLPPQPIVSSIPPGAHEEQFRLVRNPTRAALNDPDRYCYNTTRMDETIKPLPQPPWYVGYGNKIDPPDSNFLIASARYGYRGSRKIQQYSTKPYEMPSKTRTEYTPKFLHADDDFVDEYVPPILAATVNTINGLETPKLWPENTEYVEGYKKKKLPTSWKYKRETTVDLPERPKSPDTLSSLMEKVHEEQDLIRSYAKMESKGTITTAPLTAKQKFDQTWMETINKDANGTLKLTMKKVNLPHEAHTLLDPSDSLKYSGSTAMIVHSQSTDELKFRLRMERSKSKVNTPYQLKWQHVIGHFKNIENKLKRNQNMTEVIKKVADTLQEIAIRGGSETSIRRAEFVLACSRISFFEDVSGKLVSQLYSVFDPMKKDMMRFVELVFMLQILNHPEQETVDKLVTLWKCAHQYGLDRNTFDIVFEILTCCATSLSDVAEIEKHFKAEFRPKCYEFAIKGNSGSKTLSRSNSAATNSRPSTSASKEFGSTANSKKSSFVQHQYNISESYLNEDTFPEIMAACPELLQAFDAQMSARLISCYGKDDRHIEPENEAINTDGLDFSWIMKREAPKREVFGLF